MSVLCVLLASALLGGCVDDGRSSGPDPESPPDPVATLEAAIEQAVANAIIPAVEGFRAEAEAMDSAAQGFCDGLDAGNLVALQDSWRSAFEAWYRLSLYNFGPMDDNIVFPTYTFIDSLRIRGTNYLETVRSEIASDINGTRELDADYYRNKTFQRVGLLALESAIFETSTSEHSTLAADILADYEFQPRKCEVLQGLSGQLVERARYVERGWLEDHLETGTPYRDLFLANELDDGTENINQIIIAGQQFLDYLQARRVVLTAAQVSMHAWPAVTASVDEVEDFLRGDAATTASIFDVMEDTGNQNAVAAVEDSLSQVRQAIADRDADMLEITLGFLDGNYKREIADGLDVTLGITFSDGD